MSVPLRASDPRRVFRIPMPSISLGPRKRELLVYLSGALVGRSPFLWPFRAHSVCRSLQRAGGPSSVSPRSGIATRKADSNGESDATLLSRYAIDPLDPSSPHDGIPVHVAFPDWIPGILSTLGMIIINLIDKEVRLPASATSHIMQTDAEHDGVRSK